MPAAMRSEGRCSEHHLCVFIATDLPVGFVQANVDPRKPFEEWELEKLANKMRQYCPLLEDMTGASLEQVTLVADAACGLLPSLISMRTEECLRVLLGQEIGSLWWSLFLVCSVCLLDAMPLLLTACMCSPAHPFGVLTRVSVC